MEQGKINVVLPMAGRGSRFNLSGFDIPKPFIDVAGVPMFIRSLFTLDLRDQVNLIIVALVEHQMRFKIDKLLLKYGFKAELCLIHDVTEGQLCTVLEAKNLFEEGQPLCIIPSDTYVDTSIIKNILDLDSKVDGLISVFDLPGDQWSFAKTDAQGKVLMVAEKERISNHASTGIYYFKNSTQFLQIAEQMVAKNKRTKGEFYVIPIYNIMINQGANIQILKARKMHDMGTPEAKEKYEKILNG